MEPTPREWWKTIAIAVVSFVLILVGLQLMGCAPMVEYRHMSDPRESDDGYDLVCAGGTTTGNLEMYTSVCKDVTGYRGEYVQVGARYVWRDQ